MRWSRAGQHNYIQPDYYTEIREMPEATSELVGKCNLLTFTKMYACKMLNVRSHNLAQFSHLKTLNKFNKEPI